MHSITRGLLLTAPALLALGCLTNKRPIPERPPRLTVPGVSKRAQKPELPPSVTLPPTTLADGEVAVKVAAYINNMPIFESEVREGLVLRLAELNGLSDTERERKLKELREAELEKLIEREVVLDAAKERLKKMPAKVMEDLQREATREFDRRLKDLKDAYKIKDDEQLNSFFQQQGMSLANFKRSVERSFISMEFMRNLIFPKLHFIALSELRAYYEAHPEEFSEKDRAKWQDIAIDASKFPDRQTARRYAEQVASALRGGADFTATAKQLQQAGYNFLPSDVGIGEQRGEIRPAELETAVFAAVPGQVAAPVELPGAYHIIQVTERKRAGRRPMDADAQNEIRSKLQNLLAAKEYRKLIEDMKEKALIQKLD